MAPGEAQLLSEHDPHRFLRTFGVATCTAVALWFERKSSAILIHELPTLGARFDALLLHALNQPLVSIREQDRANMPIEFHIELGPLAIAKLSSEQLKIRYTEILQTILRHLPTARPFAPAKYKNEIVLSEKSVSLVLDKISGRIGRYSTWGETIESPPHWHFRGNG